jgi:precorrin-4 methylase
VSWIDCDSRLLPTTALMRTKKTVNHSVKTVVTTTVKTRATISACPKLRQLMMLTEPNQVMMIYLEVMSCPQVQM